jgi:hypothetical protein
MHLHCALNIDPQIYVTRYVQPQLKELFMLTDVDEILNSALEDSSYRSIHENYKILMDDVEDIKDDFLYNFPRLKENVIYPACSLLPRDCFNFLRKW